MTASKTKLTTKHRPFRAYCLGYVYLFCTEIDLGCFLARVQSGMIARREDTSKPFYSYILGRYEFSERKNIFARLDDTDFRVETPRGMVANQAMLQQYLQAYFNAEFTRLNEWRRLRRRWGGSTRNRHRGNYYRLVATQNERRSSEVAAEDEGEIGPRPARRSGYLPSSWDGCPRHREKNWKSQRKTAWKQGAVSPRAILRAKLSKGEDIF